MVDPEQYIQEGLKIIKTLTKQGSLIPALNACQELLRVNPYHRTVQKNLHHIEELIIQHNEQKVDMDIEATMNLWQQGRYEDLLKIYTRLYQFAPQHKKLHKLLEKATTRLDDQKKNERADFIQKAFDAIEQLFKDGRFADAIQALNELKHIDPLNEKAQAALRRAQRHLVEKKLKENTRIVESPDFERALEFYESLLTIDADNAEIKKLALAAKAHLAEQKLLAEKIHLNESIARMKEFFKSAEYEQVLQACEEIDRLDPGNGSARSFKKKASRALIEESDILILRTLKEAMTKVAQEYAAHRETFVKV